MSKWRDFSPGGQLPATWTDNLEELLSTYASANFVVVKASATTVKVPAATGVDQAGIMIMASPRYNAADTVATHPGGAAGTHDVWVTCTADTFGSSAGPPIQETDTTTRTFGLKITTSGTPSGTGAEAKYRKVAQVIWDGATITAVIPIITFAGDRPGIVPIGSIVAYSGVGDPPVDAAGGQWLLADGRLINKVTYAGYFARAGHAYNLGVDPGGGNMKIADKRGRGIIGADDMAGTRLVGSSPGAAGRLTVAAAHNNALGQNGGAERHTLITGELAAHAHTEGTSGAHAHQYQSGYNAILAGGSGWSATLMNPGGGPTLLTPYAPDGLVINDGGTEAGGDHSHVINNAGSGTPHNNMHPYEVDNLIVRVA